MSGLNDQAWERIARELPPNANSQMFRSHLASYVQGYAYADFPARYMDSREKDREKNQKVLEAARTVLDTYDLGMAWRPGLSIQEIGQRHEALVKALTEVAENVESNLQKLGLRVRVRTRPRDIFLGMVAKLWEDYGGKITTTVRHVDAGTRAGTIPQSDGPLVRYLIAVADAAGFELTRDEARGFVRKLKGKPAR